MTKARILILEDENLAARDLQQQLTELGYDVVGTTRSSDEAVLLTEQPPTLVLMDIRRLNNIDGERPDAATRHCAQKLESIGQLAGGVAHDFNNLLTVILCGTRLLKQGASAEIDASEILNEIEKAGESGAELAKQLLDFSRQQVARPQAIDLNLVVIETEKFLRRLLGSHIELTMRLDPRLGRVKTDPGQMGQVLLNLAVNARDAMPNGGKLLIETSEAIIDRPTPRTPPDIRPGPYRVLRVTDTGHGMDPTTLARIFEPFFTTKEIGKGTGLGLATVHAIVQQSGGQIHVASEINRGTTFTIYLPPTSEPIASSLVADVPEMPQGRETVLLVDDEDSIRSLGRHILAASGYEILEACDGVEALEVAARYPGRIDLLITDLIMPRMSGKNLTKTLLTQRPNLKVLCISAHGDQAGFPTGNVIRILAKPFTPVDLGNAVRQLLDHNDGRSGDELTARKKAS